MTPATHMRSLARKFRNLARDCDAYAKEVTDPLAKGDLTSAASVLRDEAENLDRGAAHYDPTRFITKEPA